MKKLAIMFVILLGSVATMQAQSFDFSCATPASGDFTGAQVDILVAAGFEELSAGEFQIADSTEDDEYYVVIVPNSDGSYQVTADTVIDAASDTLALAIAAAIDAAAAGLPEENVGNGADNGAGTNPDADNDGFLDSEEAGRLSTYGHLPNGGFIDGNDRTYRLNGPGTYHVIITADLNGTYTMTEVGGVGDVLDGLPIGQAIINATGYVRAEVRRVNSAG